MAFLACTETQPPWIVLNALWARIEPLPTAPRRAATAGSGVTVQLCGDAHLSNFGLFGTPERQMIFDINDFDETLPGPWEWDVKRLAASFEIMGRDRGFSPADRRAVVMAGVAEYRDRMRQAAGMGALSAWYDQLPVGALMNLVRDEVRVKRVSKSEGR